MNGFAAWLLAQRARRVVFIASLFPLPVLGMISAAIVVMDAQIKGPREALLDCTLALLLLAGIAWFADMDTPILLGSAMVSWVLWLVLGTIVARTGSLTLAVQAAVIIALAGLVVFNLVIGDPVAYWANVKSEQDRVVKWIEGHDQVTVRGPDVDMTLSIKSNAIASSPALWINSTRCCSSLA